MSAKLLSWHNSKPNPLGPSSNKDGPKAVTGFDEGAWAPVTIAHGGFSCVAQALKGASGLEKDAAECKIQAQVKAGSFFLAGGGSVF